MKARSIFLTGASALVLAAPAWAQSPPAPAGGNPLATAPAADAAPTADIIVTAQRRSESLQKIPLQVTVLSSDLLERQNIDSPSKLQSLVPGVKVFEVGVQPSILIRGIGGVVANILNDPAASYNFDGVSIVRPVSINGLFFDLERVEVLKGPQGTLYGGNSDVGAINVVSHRPEFTLGGSAGVEIGNYSELKTQGVLNVPLSDTFAVRASFQQNRHDGYLSGGYNDAKDVGVRVKALYQPSSDFDVLLTGTYFHSGGVGPGDVPLKSAKGSFLDPDHPWRLGMGPDLDNGALVIPFNGDQKLETWTTNAQVNWKTPIGTLTIIPSYIKTTYKAIENSGGFVKLYDSSNREESIEARLSSDKDSGSPLIWQFGGIYQNVKQITDTYQHIRGVPPGPPLYQLLPINPTTRYYGVFGQGTYSLTGKLRVTAGLRYTSVDKKATGSNTTYVGGLGGPVVSSYPTDGKGNWNNLDYRVGVDYDLTPTSLLYGNVSTGFKTGGINPGLGPNNTYKAEHLTSFQLGSKNSFFDRTLQVNLETWYWDYRDFQIQQFVLTNTPAGPNTGSDFGSANAKKAKNYGVEAQINWRATRNDQLMMSLQYDVAKYVDFTQTTVFPVLSTANYDGQTIQFAPKFTANVNYEHTFHFEGFGDLIASINDQYQSKTYIVLQKIPGQIRHSTNVTDLQLTYRTPNGRFELGGYIENLQNEPVLLFAGATPAGLWAHPRPPRTFGGRASVKF